MHAGQETTHGPAGKLHDGPMDHDEPMDGHAQDMDCCDQGPDKTAGDCDSMSHCGACPLGVIGLTPYATNMGFDPASQQYLPATSIPLNQTASPPFRPPIA